MKPRKSSRNRISLRRFSRDLPGGPRGTARPVGLMIWLLLGAAAQSQTLTYDVDPGTSGAQDGSGSWNTSASPMNWWSSPGGGGTNSAWVNMPVASATTHAVFGSGGTGGTVTVGTITVNHISVNTSGYILSGGALTLGGATPTITTNADATIESALTSTAGLTKDGASTLTLGGSTANSVTGQTTVKEGMLLLNNSTSNTTLTGSTGPGSPDLVIGDGTGTDTVRLGAADQLANTMEVVLSAGGTPVLDLNGYSETIGSLLSSNAASSLLLGAGALTVQNGIGSADTSFAGVISGTGTLTKAGTGTFTLSGTSANTHTGTTTVSAGGLTLNKTPGLDAIAGNLSAATPDLVIGNSATVATVTLGASHQIKDTAQVSIGGSGASTLVINGFNETIASLESANTAAVLNLGTGGTLTVQNGRTAASVDTEFKGSVIGSGGNLILDGGATSAFTLSGTVANTASGFTKVSAGTLNLGKTGAGVVAVTGNTTSGSNDLIIGDGAGTDAVTLLGANQIADTAEVFMDATGGTPVLNLGGFSETIGSLASANYSAAVTLGAGTLTVQNGTGSTGTDFAGVISGSGGLTKTGPAAFTLSGTNANTYTGATTVNGGTLYLNKTGVEAIAGNPTSGTMDLSIGAGTVQLTRPDQIADTAQIALTAAAGVFNLNGNNETIASIESTVDSTLALGAGTLTVQNGKTASSLSTGFSGHITGSGGLVLDALSANTFTLAGTADNAFSGAATVREGTLILGKTAGTNAIAGDDTAGTPDVIVGDGTGTEILRLTAADQIKNTAEISLNAGGLPVFDLNGNAETIGSLASANAGAAVTLGLNATLTVSNGLTAGSTDSTYAGVISGTGTSGLTVNAGAANIFTLSGTAANTYTGATTVSGGTLLLAKTATVNAVLGNITIGDGTGTDTLKLGAADQIANASAVTFNSAGTPVFNLNGFNETVASLTSTNVAANITLGAGSLTLQNTAGTTYAGTITGTGGLTMNGTNAIAQTLSGSNANTFSGVTHVTGGTLILSKTAGVDAIAGNATSGTPDIVIGDGTGADTLQLGTANQINDKAEVVMFATGSGVNAPVFNLNGLAETIGSLASTNAAASVTLGAGTLTVQNGKTAASANTTFAGVVSGSGGLILDAGSANTFTLSGGNTYTGATTVTGGTLALDYGTTTGHTNTSKLADTSTLVLNNGTTLALVGDATGTHAEVIGGTTVNGVAAVTRTGGNTATINLGALAVPTGSQLEIASTGLALTSTANTSGILNRVTINDQLATNSGGVIVPYTAYTDVNRLGGTITHVPANNVRIIEAGSSGIIGISAANTSINTLTNASTGGLATVDISGKTLTLGVAGVVTTAAGSQGLTLSGGTLTSGGSLLFLNSSPTPATTVSSAITGSISLDKAGSGDLILTGSTANTYSGLTTVNEGTLVLEKSGTVAAVPGNLTIAAGTVRYGSTAGTNQIANTSVLTLTNAASVLDLNGKSDTVASIASTQNAAALTLGAGTLTVAGTADTNFAGVISGAGGGFTKTGVSATTLSGTQANTNTGATTVNAGNLILSKTAGVDAIAGNTTAGTPDLIIGDGATADTVTLAAANQINNNAEVVLFATGGAHTLNLAGFNETIASLGSANNSATVTLGAGTLTLQNGLTTSSTNSSYSGNITGAGGLILNGGTDPATNAFTMAGTAANTYTGATTVNGGTLILNKTGVIAITGGSSAGTPDLLIGDSSGLDTVQYGANNNQIADSAEVTLSAGGTPVLDLNGRTDTIASLSSANTAATLALGAGTLTVNNGSSSNATDFAGRITGTGGGITKNGALDFTLSGTTANTNTGVTTVNGGTLLLNKTAGVNAIGGNIAFGAGAYTVKLLADNQIADSSQVDFNTSGATTLNLNNHNETLGAIISANFSSVINLGTGNLTVTAGTGTYGGIITGSGNVTLSGSNTFTYLNNYTGSTTVAGGSLTLSSNGTLVGNTTSGTPDVIIGTSATAATLTLSGAERIANTAEVVLGATGTQTLTLGDATETIGSLASSNTGATVNLNGASSLLVLKNGATATSADSTFAGVLTGTGGITLDAGASNAFTLSGPDANTNTGLTSVNNGSLLLNKTAGVNAVAGNLTIGLGTETDTVRLLAANQIANSSVVTLSTNTAVLDLNGNNETIGRLASASNTANVALGGGNLTIRTGAGTYQGTISGAGNTVWNGANSLTGTQANTYTGSTTAAAGTLTLGKTAGVDAVAGNYTSGTPDLIIGDGTGSAAVTLSAANQINDKAEVVMTSGGTSGFNLGTNSETIASLASSSASPAANLTTTVAIGSGAVLTVQNGRTSSSGDTTFAGVISGGGGALTADLGNNSTFTLAGTNTYTGTTTVNNGTLALDYTAAGGRIADTSALVLNSGTIDLVGTGSGHVEIVTSTTINGSSSILRTGTGATINLNALTINPGGQLDIQAASLANTSTANSAAGILNGVTIGGMLATKSAGAGSTPIVLYSAFTDVPRLGGAIATGANNNIRITEAGTSGNVTLAAGGTTDINTLTNSGTGGPATVDITGKTLRLGTAGVITNADGTQGLTISGGTLTAGGTVANASGQITVINDTASATTISSVIANNGTGVTSVSKNGSGELVLSGSAANTATGLTTVNEGTLTLAKTGGATALAGAATGTGVDVMINNGTLALAAAGQIADTASLNLNADGALLQLNGHNETVASIQSTAGGAEIDLGSGILTVLNGVSSTATNYAGTITGTGGLTQAGTLDLTLSGANANTYTGATTISSGSITLAKSPGVTALAGNGTVGTPDILVGTGGTAATLTVAASGQIADTAELVLGGSGTSGFVLNAGVAETIDSITSANAASTVTINAGATLTLTNHEIGAAADTTFAGHLNGTGNLTLNGAEGSTLSLTGTGNLSGAAAINTGDVIAFSGNAGNALGSAAVNIAAGSTLTYDMSPAGTTANSGSTAYTGAGDIVISSPGELTDTGHIYPRANAFNAFTGNLRLTTDSGGATVHDLFLEAATAINTQASLTIDPGTGIFSNTGGGNNSFGGGITVSGPGPTTGRGAIRLTPGTTMTANVTLAGDTMLSGEGGTYKGDFTNTADSTLTFTNNNFFFNGESNTINGAISDGTGITSLAISGSVSATLNLTGPGDNTFSGATTVTTTAPGFSSTLNLNKPNGTLALSGNSIAGTPDLIIGTGASNNTVNLTSTGNQIKDTVEVSMGGTGTQTLNFNNNSETIGSLSSPATTNAVANIGTGTLTVRNGMRGSGDTTYAGSITGSGNLVMNGSNTGVFTVTNTALHTGTTLLDSGTLSLNYDTAPTSSRLSDTSRVTLNNGTLALSGANGTHIENVSGTLGTLVTGSGGIDRIGGNTAKVNLNALTIQPGSLLSVEMSGLAMTTTTNTAGYLPGVTVGGVIAMNDGAGNIIPYNHFTDVTRLGGTSIPNAPGTHIRITEGSGLPGVSLGAAVMDISTLSNAAPGGVTPVNLAEGETLRLGAQGLITNSTDSKGLTFSGPGHLTAGGAPNTSSVLIVANDTPYLTTITSIISDNGAGVVSLAKMDDGLVLLNNTSPQTYTGTTTVNRGFLQVGFAGTGSTGTGTVTVENAGTLLGSGTVKGSTFNAQNGATVAPGDSTDPLSYDTLTFAPDSPGSVNFLPGSQTMMGIATSNTNDPTYGGNLLGTPGYYDWARAADGGGIHDVVNVAGTAVTTLNFSGDLIVDATGWGMVGKGQVFDIMDWGPNVTADFSGFDVGGNYRDGSGDNGDQFNLPDISAYGLLWDLSIFKETGKIIAVPEPSNVVLSGLGAAALLFRRRRRAA